ncbi:PAC motif [Syntrophomonas zehnderi OL-4]|uniref:HTH-type transcriptional regulatory protein TyrR n=1 Tax=Syntrophomonas zehnderi OL-4 TaxID=690567 RepID=A0A0E4GD94_9FIRM|nr:sigma 54-interacting transcriptional regulator [Syntrophomonas zehnderi]CFY02608.1 PAC motif [Syntrophomonas zehnderi OL-4]
MLVAEVMTSNPVVLNPTHTLKDVARLFLEHHIDGAPVVDDTNKLVGIITKTHFYKAIENNLDSQVLVESIMTKNVTTINKDNDAERFYGNDFRRLPVVDGDKVVGMITKSDIAAAYLDQIKDVSTELNTVLDSVYNGILSIDESYHIRTFNRAAEKIFGIPKEFALGRPYDEIFPHGPLAEVIHSGSTETNQKFEYLDKVLIANRTPILVDGKVTGAVAVVQDISDLESITNELHNATQSKEGMEAIIAASLDSIFVTDANAKVVSVNQAYTLMTGIKAEDILGKSMYELIEKGYYNRAAAIMVLEEKRSVAYTERTSTGKTALFIGTPIFDQQGEIVNALVNIHDITELETVSTELQYTRQLKEELDAVIEASFDGIFITDNKANILRVNEAYLRITGFTLEELEGQNMYDLIDKGYYDQAASVAVIENKEPVTLTQKVKETGKTILATGNPIYDEEGNIVRVLVNCRDLTELNKLKLEIEQAQSLNRHYQEELKRVLQDGSPTYIARSRKSKELMEMVRRLGQVDSTVLIQGESGVGKEIVAQELQKYSLRSEGPYIKINCAALPESLLESELFGYEPGAFTGTSKKGKVGIFELANKGTLFLDEIGEFPLKLQGKLLRVLQEGEITRIGGSYPIKIDVRIIAATNRNLYEMVEKNAFRDDLYYRLNVVPLQVPPLRERKEEIPELINYFVDLFNKKYNLDKSLDHNLIKHMMEYSWPGNVRELKNHIERALVTSSESIISEMEIPGLLITEENIEKPGLDTNFHITLKEAVEAYEKELLVKYIARYKSTRKTAAALGVSQTTIWRKALQYEIDLQKE